MFLTREKIPVCGFFLTGSWEKIVVSRKNSLTFCGRCQVFGSHQQFCRERFISKGIPCLRRALSVDGGVRNIMFFLEFLRHPSKTGAIVGSSRWLAEAIVHAAQLHAGQQVLELGPGSGAFTPYILNAIGSPDNYVALELNPDFVARLQTKFPQTRFIFIPQAFYPVNTKFNSDFQISQKL